MGGSPVQTPAGEGKRLDSWKEIAAYLSRDVTTVQRWEKREGMPVYRHVHDKRGSVYALPDELDAWRENRRPRLETQPPDAADAAVVESQASYEPTSRWRGGASARWRVVAVVVVVVVCAGLATGYVAWRGRAKAVAGPQIHSLAVLPMKNLSGDSSQEYLADGMTEALIGRLAGIRELRLTSHTSVMRFKDTKESVAEIARALGGVDAVVESSVIREGSRIRVSVQLIRAATDEHLWSETFDREMRDALTLESELAQEIADKVKVTVTGEEQRRLMAARPITPEVYESYLKGRYALGEGNSRGQIEQSIAYFQEAIAKDANFAPAYVGLANAYTELGTVFAGVPAETTRPKVLEAARRALELDSDVAEAHAVLANTLQQEWKWTDAETEYRRALELSPNDGVINMEYAQWLSDQGRTEEAVATARRARELDPVAVSGSGVSWILFQAHKFDEAIRESRGAVAVHPENANVLLGLGFALLGKDEAEEAVQVLEKTDAVSKGSPAVEGVLVRAYAHSGRREDALRLLEKLKRRRETGYVPAGAFVNAYLGLGDEDEAFAWMEQAYKERSNILQFVKTHPFFDSVRGDARFVDLQRRIGLE